MPRAVSDPVQSWHCAPLHTLFTARTCRQQVVPSLKVRQEHFQFSNNISSIFFLHFGFRFMIFNCLRLNTTRIQRFYVCFFEYIYFPNSIDQSNDVVENLEKKEDEKSKEKSLNDNITIVKGVVEELDVESHAEELLSSHVLGH